MKKQNKDIMYESIRLRIPQDMLKEIKRMALIEDRTLNGQIIHILRKTEPTYC